MIDKYGEDNVSQICTFTRMQGRAALKDVLRVRGVCSFDEMNEITSFVPDESEISDKLEEMRKADREAGGDGEASIIYWALENHPKELSNWCHIDDDGKLQGPLAKVFEQAIRLEGTKRSLGKHPAGLILSNEPLSNVCPMVYDKSEGNFYCGMEQQDLEDCGHIKFDFLSLACLNKIHMAIDILSGKIE